MKKLLALISCIVICSICVIPVNANAYPILSDWAKEEAYLAEANDLFQVVRCMTICVALLPVDRRHGMRCCWQRLF